MEITNNLIHSLEKPFLNQEFTSEQSFEIELGTLPIILSAPHSVSQIRLGNYKKGEYRTGVIVKLLHQLTGCYSIYKTKNVGDDANFDQNNVYKDELIKIIRSHHIRCLFDVHIMSPEREHMVDIGTGKGENVKNNSLITKKAKQAFIDNGITNVEVDKLFPASFPYTVSSHIARECGIDCLQFEINWQLLDTSQTLDNFMAVMKSMITIINDAKHTYT